MPVGPTYPGVYIEEIPSQARTIAGVSTSITAFVGAAERGASNTPIRIKNFSDFETEFGGLSRHSMLGYAVQQFFTNGGSDAVIVRVHNRAKAATLDLPALGNPLALEASSPGSWGDQLEALVDHDTRDPTDDKSFNLIIREYSGNEVKSEERYDNVSVDPDSPRHVTGVLETRGALLRVREGEPLPLERPSEGGPIDMYGDGDDGGQIGHDEIAHPDLEASRKGLYALEDADPFNLLCIAPPARGVDTDPRTWAAAHAYCVKRRAILIVDPPATWLDAATAEAGANNLSALGLDDSPNAALYFPRVRMADPENDGRLETFTPAGAVAGLIARTDAQHGVWKAPAGIEASLRGVRELTCNLTDEENARLNAFGVNCLREVHQGIVPWGARTLAGADRLASQWKYLSVRRLALFIEESVHRGTRWGVFESNDESLWSQIRLNVGRFMHSLFRQGAFQGASPEQAYYVKCDGRTTSRADFERGFVNIEVGVAPLRPAEFVTIRITHELMAPGKSHVFVLRVWPEPPQMEGAPAEFRGVLEHVPSRERRHFRELEELARIIPNYLEP
ncbi:MAG: phage tail sheath family protein [Gemmatimonadetes bacterium]|uniref:Phage tail sheath family protein n=1 Tax=Candidatus Kutchimonas denitrificans TaxID=3056748 RepID=A0AAE4Z8N6_9BACT|nr:phage tail sheath family protein [Gemmatimonadota bacterium]NIR75860.1 phage tail sheath family protein [Candidatus Kutchimonas denitrificans]NIS02027.1 phage tail sheath family protein [Gemmatimonadota bacterium]NIT67831.1 phage tail sheath family protein [Gemmatimonadota bacterium]NIU53818.1 phage tail sheath family protein [Gemmatimonadota bacterium]